MLTITLDLDTGAAKLAQSATVKVTAQVPVKILTVRGGVAESPGALPAFALTLGTDAAPPAVVAYCDTFSTENETTFTGTLNCNDSRLVSYMATKGQTALVADLAWTVDGETQVAPNFAVTVQPRLASGPEAEEGGPVYLTWTTLLNVLKNLNLATIPIGSSAQWVPIANGIKLQLSADGGATWQDGPTWIAS